MIDERRGLERALRALENQLVELKDLKVEVKRQADEVKFIEAVFDQYLRAFEILRLMPGWDWCLVHLTRAPHRNGTSAGQSGTFPRGSPRPPDSVLGDRCISGDQHCRPLQGDCRAVTQSVSIRRTRQPKSGERNIRRCRFW